MGISLVLLCGRFGTIFGSTMMGVLILELCGLLFNFLTLFLVVSMGLCYLIMKNVMMIKRNDSN